MGAQKALVTGALLLASCASTNQKLSQAAKIAQPSSSTQISSEPSLSVDHATSDTGTPPKHKFEGQAVFDRIRVAVRSALCPKDQRVFDSIVFYFPTDSNIQRVRAGRTDDGRRAVEVSSGFLNFNMMILEGIVFSVTNTRLEDEQRWPNYLSYLASSINNRSTPLSSNLWGLSVESYFKWAGVSNEDSEKFLKENQETLKEFTLDSFVFALLHEVGHHVLNHTLSSSTPLAQSRRQEWEADLYAMSGIARLKQSPVGAIPYFIFSSDLEGTVKEATGDHDPAICRSVYLMEKDGSSELTQLRQQAAHACGRDATQIDAALASTNRAVCFRPNNSTSSP